MGIVYVWVKYFLVLCGQDKHMPQIFYWSDVVESWNPLIIYWLAKEVLVVINVMVGTPSNVVSGAKFRYCLHNYKIESWLFFIGSVKFVLLSKFNIRNNPCVKYGIQYSLAGL